MIRIKELYNKQYKLNENITTIKYKTKDAYTKLADYSDIINKVTSAKNTPFIVNIETINGVKALKLTCGSFEAYLIRVETNVGEQIMYSYYLNVKSSGNKFDNDSLNRLFKFIKDTNSNITKDIKWEKSNTDGRSTTKEKEVSLTSDGKNTYNAKYYLCTSNKSSGLITDKFISALCNAFIVNRWDCKHTYTTDEYKISTKEKYKVDKYIIEFNNKLFAKTPKIIISCFKQIVNTQTGLHVVGVVQFENVPNAEYFVQHKDKMFKRNQLPQTRDSKQFSSENASFYAITDVVSKKHGYMLNDVNTTLPMTPPMEKYNRQYKLEKRNERTQRTINQFNLNDKINKLEKELMQIEGVVDVEFDLDGFYDNLNQVILIPKYDIDVRRNDYYQARREMLYKILSVSKNNGLTRTDDTIEDYGEHLYIVMSCDNTWNVK